MEKTLTTNPFYHYQDFWKSKNFKEWETEQSQEFKQYRKLWQECPKNRKIMPAPLSINIELTDICNAKVACIMCPKWLIERHNMKMSFEEAKEILDEARAIGVYAVNLNGAGESLIHPDFVKIVKYAKKIGFLDVMVHTNATMLNEKLANELIDSGLTRLITSVDSHIPEVYAKIRPSFDFNQVYNNVKKFVELRDKKGKREPILRVTIVVMKDNLETIKDTINFWNFADYITVNDCMYFDKFKVFDFDKPAITKKAKDSNLCYVCSPLYQQLTVTVDKKIIVCSTIYAKNNGVLGKYAPGQGSLLKVWEGDGLKEMRSCHSQGQWDAIKACSLCDLPQIELLKRMRNIEGVMLS